MFRKGTCPCRSTQVTASTVGWSGSDRTARFLALVSRHHIYRRDVDVSCHAVRDWCARTAESDLLPRTRDHWSGMYRTRFLLCTAHSSRPDLILFLELAVSAINSCSITTIIYAHAKRAHAQPSTMVNLTTTFVWYTGSSVSGAQGPASQTVGRLPLTVRAQRTRTHRRPRDTRQHDL